MSGWKEVRLGEIADIQTGPFGSQLHKEDYVKNGTPIVTVEHLGNKQFNTNNLPCVTDSDRERLSKYIAYEGDVVFSRVGSVDRCSYVDKTTNGWLFSGRCLRVRPFNNVSGEYLYYYFNLYTTKQYIRNVAVGTTMPSINTNILSDVPILLPSFETQYTIASILSSLDDKIAVNKKICENLEAQAQALFKHWFVDFAPFKNGKFIESELGLIPEGWRVVSLDEMTSKFGTGLNPRQNFKLGEGDNYYVTIKNMGNNRVYLDDRCDKVTDEAIEKINKRSKLQKGDLLFSGIGTIGRVAMITETPTNWNTSESVFNMHPAEGYSTEFLYVLLLSDAFQQYVKIHAQGGVQQGIRMASLKQYLMPVPDHNTLKTFDDIIVPIISQIREKDKENDYLATLRDTLLPKLMSGQIKV